MYIKHNQELCKDANGINLELIKFGYATVDSLWKGKNQNPLCSRLYYIIRGKAQIFHDNKMVELESGKWYILPAGFSFEYGCESEMEHIYFHIKLTGTDNIDILNNCKGILSWPTNIINVEEIKSYTEKRGIADGIKLKLTVYNAINSIIEENNVILNKKGLSTCIQKATEYIKENLSATLNIEQIADACFVSKSTITKSFKKELKISVHEYRNQELMLKAGVMLESGNMSILSISEKLGFSDQFYFSRRFKQHFDMSPLKYRKSRSQ